jgi:trk system potassium uptake protein TrkH
MAVSSGILCFSCAVTILRNEMIGKIFGAMAAIGCYGAALPYILGSPFIALTSTVSLISVLFALIDFGSHTRRTPKSDHVERCHQRAFWGLLMVPLVILISIFTGALKSPFSPYIISFSTIVALGLFLHWSITDKSGFRLLQSVTGIVLIGTSLVFSLSSYIIHIALLISLSGLIVLRRNRGLSEIEEPWWEVLLNHPARALLSTFMVLCVSGTVLLAFPISLQNQTISLVDAAFTSVSAVCVTGLIVLDTPKDFSMVGQFIILLLIQLGGLGIMGIATIALHAMGRRLSLKHERLLTSMTDTGHNDLVKSLVTIFKFTFVAEGFGAILLTSVFCSAGDPFFQALWRGVFTAVSAFCNAGFSLQSNSLISYQSNPLVLHIVAMLIVFGGLAPATSLWVPKWIAGKSVPVHARITLTTTAILLLVGTFLLMAIEWNGVLSGMSLFDKIQNAWFQSVTLRTAGFNSVDIADIASHTFLIMIVYMFIGGSPGGTAGGVKTTTIGILAMTFWSNITNRKEIIAQNRHIHSATVYRAITIIAAGLIVWFAVVLMLEATQEISARDLIFEATSAIGTVGLSTGATAFLDEIGKIIIIIAMFVGRIGPVTLFMLLSNDRPTSVSRCPEANISLT